MSIPQTSTRLFLISINFCNESNLFRFNFHHHHHFLNGIYRRQCHFYLDSNSISVSFSFFLNVISSSILYDHKVFKVIYIWVSYLCVSLFTLALNGSGCWTHKKLIWFMRTLPLICQFLKAFRGRHLPQLDQYLNLHSNKLTQRFAPLLSVS